jgi:hypothetical protein
MLLPGTVFDVGTIDYSKVNSPKVGGTIASNCPSGKRYTIRIYQRVFGTLLDRGGVCVARVSIPSLSPGRYRLLLTSFDNEGLIGTEDISLRAS